LKYLALCSPGVESLLKEELKRLGAEISASQGGRVDFQGNSALVYRTLLGLRTSDRILLEVGRFHAENFEELFEKIRVLTWEEWIPEGGFPVIDKVRIGEAKLHSITSVQSIAHKAILTRLTEKWGKPDLDPLASRVTIRVYIDKDEVVLGLDLCGEPLSKRGYRTAGGEAPLKETLAAALVLWSGWRRNRPLVDPLCGSATILIEALLYAINRAPGLNRKFLIESLPFFEPGVFQEEVEKAVSQERLDVDLCIYGADRDYRSLNNARGNLERLGLPQGWLDQRIHLEKCELGAFSARNKEFTLLTNPPWGTRLGDKNEADAVLKDLGAFLKKHPVDLLGVITQDENSEELLGLKNTSKRRAKSGGLDVFYTIWKAPPLDEMRKR